MSKTPIAEPSFRGFERPDANYVYCPNQFFDVCLPHASRGTLRLVAYLLRQTLGFRDADGNPIREQVSLSYDDFIQAGISRGGVRAVIAEAIEGRFVECVLRGRAKAKGNAGRSSQFQLRWGEAPVYHSDRDAFDGFFTGEGCRSPIPNAFFDYIVPRETLAVIKVVGTILRHTVGYENQFGRRQQAPLSYTRIQQFARIGDRSTLSQAIRRAIAANYIERIGEGTFDSRREEQQAAVYAAKWQAEATNNTNGSKSRPAVQFKNPTRVSSIIQPENADQSKKPTSHGTESRPVEQSKNPTTRKTEEKDNCKQQPVVVDQEKLTLLIRQGITQSAAKELAARASVEEIRRQIEWLDHREPANRPAMLRRAIEECWTMPEAIERRHEVAKSRQRDARLATELRQREEAGHQQREERRQWRTHMLDRWRELPNESKRDLTERALNQTESQWQRRMILNSSLDDPAREVLEVMESADSRYIHS